MKECTDLEANFFIQIPAGVWTDQDLSANEKMLYGIIKALSNNEKNTCYASNAYLADSFGVSATTASKWIKTLKRKKLIRVQVNRNKNMEVESRFIRPTPPPSDEGRVPPEMRGGSPLKKQHSNKRLVIPPPTKEEVADYFSENSLKGSYLVFFELMEERGWDSCASWKLKAAKFSATEWTDKGVNNGSSKKRGRRDLPQLTDSLSETGWATRRVQH